MIFLSQRPNNDPEKYVAANGARASVSQWAAMSGESRKDYILDPRPEFTQTRDPLPVKNLLTPDRYPDMDNALHFAGRDASLVAWSPRHEEFDTPVNPILAHFRRTRVESPELAKPSQWLDGMDDVPRSSYYGQHPEEVAHARRVLHLLAVISE